jgi:hypothetical protein
LAAKLPAKIKVDTMEFAKGQESSLNSIGARASTFTSPVNGSYAAYIGKALTDELASAGKLDANASKMLSGVIEKNYLSAAGLNTNESEIAVRFKLTDGHAVKWESSFMGAIAIPRAIQNYVVTVQMLLAKLYADPDFSKALVN